MQSVADEFEGKVNVGFVEITEEEDLAVRFGVMQIPTIILFKDGEKVDQLGKASKEAYVEKINALL